MKKYICYILVLVSTVFIGCSSDEEILLPKIISEIPEEGYSIKINEEFTLSVEVENGENADYLWLVDGEEYSQSATFIFTPNQLVTYQVTLQLTTTTGKDQRAFSLTVLPADDRPVTDNSSAFITQVFDYQYAPGQHANSYALGADGSNFIGDTVAYALLGGWGGYITAGFDHTITNQEGYDFGVYTQPGAGSEPAVVYVMKDLNGDGLPNDSEWIELKGSEFDHEETIRDYEVTYYKPEEGANVTWTDNQGNSGELVPGWPGGSWWWDDSKEEVTFSGVKLPDSHYNSAAPEGQMWINYEDRFAWGYAENYGGTDHDATLKANLFDIDNAVDQDGNAVTLEGIDFIKVQTGVFQVAGWLNEISTEVRGAFDYQMIQP
ncbi:PKD-like domain-containing protein [Limibacter armeniacum]|uniref:PKD-like domain-containing protein n=1 Tax=Limibacter armeniacum TaxID=466084 RepID=UPI002FE5BC53